MEGFVVSEITDNYGNFLEISEISDYQEGRVFLLC